MTTQEQTEFVEWFWKTCTAFGENPAVLYKADLQAGLEVWFKSNKDTAELKKQESAQ